MTIDERWQKNLEQYFISNVSYGGKFVPVETQGFVPVQNKIPAYDGFDSIPYYNYCYNSAYAWWGHIGGVNFTLDEEGNDILHIGMAVDSDNESGAVKHYFADDYNNSSGIDPRFFLTDLEVHQSLDNNTDDLRAKGYNIVANYFNPWTDMYFNRIKLGIRFKVIDTTIPWGFTGYLIDVDNIDDLKNLDKDRYYVWRTETYNWIKNDAGGWFRGNNHSNSFNICNINSHFIVQQNGYYGGGYDYDITGVNLVPQCMFDFQRNGDAAQIMGGHMPLRSADTGYNIIGLCPSDGSDSLDLKCVVGSLQRLKSGVTYYCTTRYGNEHRYIFRQVMHIDDILREVAYLGIIACPFVDPDTNTKDYIGYVNVNGEATGELIPYSDWDKSDSLQLQHNLMSEMPDIPVKPPYKPEGDDLDYEYDSDIIPLNSNTPFVDVGADVWAMTRGQVGHMFGLFNGNTLPKDFEPLNQIISLAVFPMNLDSVASAATTNIFWGYRSGEEGQISRQVWPDEHYSEPIQGRKIGNVIRTFNMGSIDIAKELENKWGCPFLDYDCSVEVYCPWVGIIPVDVNKVMGKTITVYLTVDFISGDCTSVVYCSGVPIAYGSGVCSAQIPLSSQEYGLYRRKSSDAMLNTVLDSVNVFGSQLGTERVAANFVGEMMPTFSVAGAILAGVNIIKNISSTASGLRNTRGTTTMTGSFGGFSAFANPQKAYVTIMRPVPKIPKNYNSTFGHIALDTKTLSSCKGLTSVCNIDVSGLSCTTEEKNAIKAALENGVRIK